MQRMKHIAMGAFSMAIATAGLAHAGDPAHDPANHHAGQSGHPPQQSSSVEGSSVEGSSAAADPSTDPAMNPSRSSASSASSSQGASGAMGLNRMQVEQMQEELASRGLYRGEIDGIAGPQTMAALRQFQQQQGLSANSGLDDATRQALGIQSERQPVAGSQSSSGPELERPVGREGGTSAGTGSRSMRSQVQLDTLNPQQLRTLQTRLQELGFYQGPVDGVLGEGTRNGLRQFYQTQADLAARGIITDATIGTFGVSPQGLNPSGSSSQQGSGQQGAGQQGAGQQGSSSQWGTEPRGIDPRGSMNPSRGASPSGSRSNTGSSGSGDTSTGNTGSSGTRSTPPSPSPSSPSTSPSSPTPSPSGTSSPR